MFTITCLTSNQRFLYNGECWWCIITHFPPLEEIPKDSGKTTNQPAKQQTRGFLGTPISSFSAAHKVGHILHSKLGVVEPTHLKNMIVKMEIFPG